MEKKKGKDKEMKLSELFREFENSNEEIDAPIFRIIAENEAIEGSESAIRSFCPHLLDANVATVETNPRMSDMLIVKLEY